MVMAKRRLLLPVAMVSRQVEATAKLHNSQRSAAQRRLARVTVRRPPLRVTVRPPPLAATGKPRSNRNTVARPAAATEHRVAASARRKINTAAAHRWCRWAATAAAVANAAQSAKSETP